ncbi:hypothetical protein DDF62_21030 [Caulobacter radicis]|uniref:hypothetical protein n=1 Tax=Caulobacter radicis TaxID=2172650 RepID=UPI000D5886F1|nr:hypothetical protein [Caulobacter radicis]PVM85019.1 hypothetical protein DDF62_21030 [Caulobacter radicis]
MKCNFEITQGVEFTGAFGCLDVHNAYELTAAEAEGQRVVLRFAANQHRFPGRPLAFEVVFEGASLFETDLPADLSGLCIEEIGFLAPDDRDYGPILDRGRAGDGDHLAFKWQIEALEGVVRIAAEAVEVRVTIGAPAEDVRPAHRKRWLA